MVTQLKAATQRHLLHSVFILIIHTNNASELGTPKTYVMQPVCLTLTLPGPSAGVSGSRQLL